MSAQLTLSGVATSFGARPLFAGLDVTLAAGDVVGLVGPNGSGKTTLLRVIAGELTPDAGSVRLSPSDAAVGYLPQSPPNVDDTILAYAERRTGVTRANAALEASATELADGVPGADDRYALALHRWLSLGGADLAVRLAEVVPRVGLDVDIERPLGSLSGGQAARAGLATILVSRFDVLLLDEPTNNLDAAGLDQISEFVRGLNSPVLIASHDRAFLDDVATSVLELDLHQQSVQQYAGGWSDYQAAKAQDTARAADAYAAYQSETDALMEDARRKAEWARKGRAKAAQLGPHQGIAKKFKGDKARRMDQRAARARDAAERREVVEGPRKQWQLIYGISEAPPPSEVVLTLDSVVVRAGEFTVGPVSAQVVAGDRVLLAGPNGSGKSTFLDAIRGLRNPAAGRVSWGTRVSLGVIDQTRDIITGKQTLLERTMQLLGSDDASATRTLLAKFGLGPEHVQRPCDTQSVGERTRAALAVLQGRAVNVLILDEPTNHLDVPAIEQLQAAIERFSGTVLLVTHDRTLAKAFAATALWTFNRNGDAATVKGTRP